jgi:hypothetical protein
VGVGADVGLADVVAPDDQDVRSAARAKPAASNAAPTSIVPVSIFFIRSIAYLLFFVIYESVFQGLNLS